MNNKGELKYIPTLDGWRAVAILLVMASHAFYSLKTYYGENEWLTIFSSEGLMGVRIFFGISGFLITSKILDEIQKTQQFSLKNFYYRRIFRLGPALLLFCSVIGLLSLLNIISISLLEWFGGILFFANFITKSWYTGHLWSLSVEEHFYIVWPLLILFFNIQKRPKVVLMLIAVFVIWRLVSWKYGLFRSPALFWGRTDIQIDGLLWGCLLAILMKDEQYQVYRKWFTSHLFAYASLTLFVGLFFIDATDYKFRHALYAVQACLIPIFIAGFAANPQTLLSKFLEISAIKWIGRISYSLYLWQQLFLTSEVGASENMGVFQHWPINIFAAFACATLSYYLVEKPIIRFGHKFTRKRDALRKARHQSIAT
ncbi:acyltransferase [Aliikangiella marina]|uniref:Acyltransferase n=1 Tax=Aliikangiella marina TaxID=1712262 RepID=A0A545TBK6_9GAMM|nr:acyltransferase [Aliikangiella marina]TQV74608.1 acyltransferase [Aliikangiella marina]